MAQAGDNSAPVSDSGAGPVSDSGAAPGPPPYAARRYIIPGLAAGHTVFHWIVQSFVVVLPEIQTAFNLNSVGVGGVLSIRELASGLVTLPGGIVVDLLRRHWGVVLALCLAAAALGSLAMGFSPVYPLLLVGIGAVAVSHALWHLPASAALSHHFAQRRGAALAWHGVGGSVGDVAGPLATGALLAFLAWRDLLNVYAIAPFLLAFMVVWAFRGIGRTPAPAAPAAAGDAADRPPADAPSAAAPAADTSAADASAADTSAGAGPPANSPANPAANSRDGLALEQRLAMTRRLLRSPALWGLTLVRGLRGMALVSLVTVLPLYLDNELEVSALSRGWHIGLLIVVGLAAKPLAGYLSDRWGRKQVLTPGLLWSCLAALGLVAFPDGVMLAVMVALLGLFLYPDQPIVTAAVFDVVGREVASTGLGVVACVAFFMSAASALLAGAIYETAGFAATMYYIAALFAAAALVFALLPLPRRAG